MPMITLPKKDNSGTFRLPVATGGLTLTNAKVHESVIDAFGRFGDNKFAEPVRIFAKTTPEIFAAVKESIEKHGEISTASPLPINDLAVSFDDFSPQ